jgi:phage terminase large subunit-like protein
MGYVFDREAANRPVKFIERICKQSMGEFAGKPLLLLDWQKTALWRTFGWLDSDGRRRCRELFIAVPKKNGKTELASALSLYMLMGDDEPVARIALAAVDKKQASAMWEEADRMIKASPYLKKHLESSEFHKRIRYGKRQGEIVTHSSDVDSKEGGSLSCVIIDELHLWTKGRRKAWNVYAGSGAARKSPLKVVISTAGNDRESVMWEQTQRAWKVESGELIDPYLCAVVYGPKPGEDFDPHGEGDWFRYNPSLGHTMSLAGFKADYEAAKNTPSDFADWKQRRLNVWSQKTNRFIDIAAWDRCEPVRTPDEIAASGEPTFAGADLSDCRDMTALSFITGSLATGFDVRIRAWMTKHEAERRHKQYGIPFMLWAEQGYLELCTSSHIDVEEIEAAIEEEYERQPFASLFVDPFNAKRMNSSLHAKGVPVTEIRQGMLSLSPPTKELDRLIAVGEWRHGDNPLFTWTASNCEVERDKTNNIMFRKPTPTSVEKIDPMAASVNALAAAMAAELAKQPVYSESPRITWVKF